MNTPQTFDFQAGPDISGYWKNYKTGQIVRIKDTIFEDNNLVGITYDGQMVNMNKLKDFVKYNPTEEEKTQQNRPQASVQTSKSVLLRGLNTDTSQKPVEIDRCDDIDSNIDSSLNGNPGESSDEDIYGYEPYDYVTNREHQFKLKRDDSVSISKTSDPDRVAIIKVLNNLSENQQPKISVSVDWEVPDGVKFLKDYLNITAAQIADVVNERYVNISDVIDKITEKICSVLGVSRYEKDQSTSSKEVENTHTDPSESSVLKSLSKVSKKKGKTPKN